MKGSPKPQTGNQFSPVGSMMDKPLVRMPERALCIRHFHRLIPEEHVSGTLWQTRYLVAMVKISELMLSDPEITRKIGGHLEMASAIIAQHTPLCCYLGEFGLQEIERELRTKFPI